MTEIFRFSTTNLSLRFYGVPGGIILRSGAELFILAQVLTLSAPIGVNSSVSSNLTLKPYTEREIDREREILTRTVCPTWIRTELNNTLCPVQPTAMQIKSLKNRI